MNIAASCPQGERPSIDRTVRCSIYDCECINPAFCNERDACCAGDPDCKPVDVGEEPIDVQTPPASIRVMDSFLLSLKRDDDTPASVQPPSPGER